MAELGSSLHAAGSSVFGTDKLIEYIVGNLPIVISVPHGQYYCVFEFFGSILA